MKSRAFTLFSASLGCLAVAAAATPPKASNSDVGFDTPAALMLKTAPSATTFPNSGAATLRDETVVHLKADGTMTETVHETVKIFNQRGRGYADVSFPYNSSTQAVTGIHARTLLPDGRVLVVKPADVHESSPFSDYTMYDDAKRIGFSMPGVEDGAIVEYTYSTMTRRALLPGQYADQWAFQDGQNPVLLSRLTIVAPASLPLQTQIHNAPGLKPVVRVAPDGSRKTYVWEMRDLPDITPEPMMPPSDAYLPWMQVSTLPSWQTIAQWYQKLAQPRMAVAPEVAAQVKQLCAGKTTDTDKARAIFYWVEGKTRYVALELGLSAYQPHAAADVYRDRYGDCKDMATLLITMLHEAGIKTAWPVLLDAGNKLPEHDRLASPSAFDHAIVRADIDGKPFWFDSTAELSTFGEIPGGDRGVDAFVIRDGVGAWETIPVGEPTVNQMAVTTHVTLAADGSADCETATRSSGDAALGLRSMLRSVKPNQMQDGFRSMVNEFSPNATLKTFTLSPLDDRDKPMTFDCVYHAPDWATKTGSLLLISNDGAKDGGSAFQQPTRTYPIYNEQAGELVSDMIVALPAGYTVEDKPDDVHETTPLGGLDATYRVTGQTLTIHIVTTSVPGMIPASDYAKYKAQHESTAEQLKQPIVLRKEKV